MDARSSASSDRRRSKQRVRALRSVRARDCSGPSELRFRKGQVIVVLERDEAGRRFRGGYASAKRGKVTGWVSDDAVTDCAPADDGGSVDGGSTGAGGGGGGGGSVGVALGQQLAARASPAELVQRGILEPDDAPANSLPEVKSGSQRRRMGIGKRMSSKKNLLGSSKDLHAAADADKKGQSLDASVLANALANGPDIAVIGTTLGELMNPTGMDQTPQVPAVLARMIQYLHGDKPLNEMGVFRLTGSTVEVAELRAFWDAHPRGDNAAGEVAKLDFSKYEIHSITSLLKLFLRELRDPLLTFELYDKWLAANTVPVDERVTAVADVVAELPVENYAVLEVLLGLLAAVADRSDQNKMTAANLGIVFGPTLLRKQQADALTDMLGNQDLVELVEFLIVHHQAVLEQEDDLPLTSSHGGGGGGGGSSSSSSSAPHQAHPAAAAGAQAGAAAAAAAEAASAAKAAAEAAAAASSSSSATDAGGSGADIQVIQNVDLDGKPLPEGWEMGVDGKGRVFFVDHINKKTSWKDPRTNQRHHRRHHNHHHHHDGDDGAQDE